MVTKKNKRRNRNQIKRVSVLFIPLSLLVSIICIGLIIFLVNALHGRDIISPIAKPRSTLLGPEDIYQSELEKILKEKKIDYSSVSKPDQGFYEITLPDSAKVIISSQKDINRQISSLQYILNRLTMEGKQFSRLDMRFDKPVIVFE